MTLVDANVLMYAAGADHPNKEPSLAFLDRVADGDIDAILDAETLQEILHRYRAIVRWREGRLLYEQTRRIFPIVLSISSDIVDRARDLLDAHDRLMARDALHAAVVLSQGLDSICSYDRDYDVIDGFVRIEP